jgi:hypothetical protein
MVVALGHAVSIIRHMPHEKPASHAGAVRGPQSAQSLPRPHEFNSEPGPPSSQMPSDTELHSLVQTVRRDPHGGPAGGGGEGGDRGDGGREGGEGGRGGGEGGEGGGEGGSEKISKEVICWNGPPVITLLNTQFALRTMDARRAATVPALVTFWKPPT